ncbi:serine/threonine-protein kinase [Nonomuraea rhodomycinica]|uniref:Protein kinase n=1 Tax=Nonomuraea rhodomycinica TaxID=1712872 RepID=A0A7Y6IQM6_9ACTN|nr:serine/threonine-protein kinase [Nonomuraea rhodomycinica]NUW42582.1 protein kinase [Nonomuraea rhodomycinica]
MPAARPLRPGDPERIGPYRIVGVLGSGGQGIVYKGERDGGGDVAVKVVHSHLSQDTDVTKGFLREVEAARRVAAFCTAAVLDVGTVDGRPYIVSEYVAGDTLQAVVRERGPRTAGVLDRLAISTLTALAAIHEAGIVHRDFKPANVLMGPEGPIVIDFGIAKALDATTMASGPVGTPAYMSPEQFRGERVGPASDVFAWAGTMVFAATGRAPFRGETVPAILNQVLSGTPDLTGVPPHLVGPIQECLAKDPAARPTPAALLQRLIGRTGPAAPGVPAPSAASAPVLPPSDIREAPTSPSRPRTFSRRALIGGAAVTAAAAVSAFALLGGRDEAARPVSDERSPAPTGTAGPSATPTKQPFGAPLTEPVPLARDWGAVTVLAASGPLVACGTDKGTVLAWTTGRPAATRLGDGGASVTAVACGERDGTPVVVSGHGDGRMRLWSATGESLATHRAADPIIGVAVAGDRVVAVSQKYDSLRDLHSVVRLWDVATGKQLGATVTDHFQGVSGLAFGTLDGKDVLVTGDGHNRIQVRRLSDGKVARTFGTGEIGGVERLACAEIGGRAVLVSTHLDATLRVYDLATGKRREKWTFSAGSPDDRGVTALTTGRTGEAPIAVAVHDAAGEDVLVRVWNLDGGDVVGTLGPGPGGAIRTAALAEAAGLPVVTGVTEDRTLRTWNIGPA